MRTTDWQAVGEIAGEALAATGTVAKDLHEGIASRSFRILGTAAEPMRIIHDGASRAVYAGVHGGLRSLARGDDHERVTPVAPGHRSLVGRLQLVVELLGDPLTDLVGDLLGVQPGEPCQSFRARPRF